MHCVAGPAKASVDDRQELIIQPKMVKLCCEQKSLEIGHKPCLNVNISLSEAVLGQERNAASDLGSVRRAMVQKLNHLMSDRLRSGAGQALHEW